MTAATITNWMTIIGVPSIILALIYIGRKLQVLDYLERESGVIKQNLKVVCDYLTRNHTEFNPQELQSLSPIQLTEQGRELIAKLGFEKIVDEYTQVFFGMLDRERPATKYDVEVAAIKAVQFLSDQPYMKPLKVFLYNNPDRDLANTAPTLGVYLRDKYLAAHPEISE